MVINSDQTTSKRDQVVRSTMAPKSAKKVGVVGIVDKRMIILTLTVTMNEKTLTFQATYKGKTKQSLPKVNIPAGFSLSANIKHYSNTQEVLKHLEEIVIPYVDTERKKKSKA